MDEKQVLKIVFEDEDGKLVTFSVDDPKDTITSTQIEEFADAVIESAVFVNGSSQSQVSALKEAYILTTKKTPLEAANRKGGRF